MAFFVGNERLIVMGLNAKQEAFCLHYAKTGNATESYKVAYKTKSERSAISAGNRLLKNVDIQNKLRELKEQIQKPAIMDIEEMQERLSAMGRGETWEESVTPKGMIVKKRISEDTALKAITQLAKMQGVAENVNLNVSIPVIAGDVELED